MVAIKASLRELTLTPADPIGPAGPGGPGEPCKHTQEQIRVRFTFVFLLTFAPTDHSGWFVSDSNRKSLFFFFCTHLLRNPAHFFLLPGL